jgi:hypothetical protein
MAGKVVWTYAYEIVPPQPESRLRAVKALLAKEQTEAKIGSGTWEARIVCERRVTHILIVSDNPDLDGERNQRLNAQLTELGAAFSLTAPMPVTDEDATPIPDDGGTEG